MWAARVVCWGFDLGEGRGYDVLADHYNPRCEPPWSEPELRKKCRDAMSPDFKHRRGWLLDQELPGRTSRPVASPWTPPLARTDRPTLPADLGQLAAAPAPAAEPFAPPGAAADPQAGQGEGASAAPAPTDGPPLPGVEPDDPFHLARLFLRGYRHPDGLTLRYWGQEFAEWGDGAYDRLADDDAAGRVIRCVEVEFARLHALDLTKFNRADEKGDDKAKLPRKRKVTRGLVGDVLAALRAECALPAGTVPPCWSDTGPPPAELLVARNAIVHLPSYVAGSAHPSRTPTPQFVTLNRTAFDFDPRAAAPVHWLAFLGQLWPEDPDSVACLQEWFGYLLTPDTSLHKMLMVVGPPRSGKGTIGRVLKGLIGDRNIGAPTLGQLDTQFGLQDLHDKTVALIADARLSGRADAVAVTEQLLSISGEDPRTIDRKHKAPVTKKLNTRFVLFSNELPRFGDASGAIVGRLCLLRLTRSFLGEEDTELLEKLLPELPGILLWAIDGWARLRLNRKFTAPESAQDLMDDAEALASPIRLFVRERCEVGDGEAHEEKAATLYEEWKRWCADHGRDKPGTEEMFARDLRAAVPSIRKIRPRDGSTRRRVYAGIRILSINEQLSDDL